MHLQVLACVCAGVGVWLCVEAGGAVVRGLLLQVQSVCECVCVCMDAGACVKAPVPRLSTGGWRALQAGMTD